MKRALLLTWILVRSGEKANAKAMSPTPDRIFHTLSSLVKPFHPTGIPARLLTKCPFPAYIYTPINLLIHD